MVDTIDARNLTPGVIRAARWFSRILWFFMILAVIAAIGYGNGKVEEIEQLREKNTQLRDENKALKKELEAK